MTLVFLAALVVLAWFDLKRQRIPIEPIFLLLIVGLLGRAVIGDAPNALLGLMIGFFFFGLQFFLSKGRWIGDGDIWLGMAMGAWLGWEGMLIALYVAYIGGGLLALLLLGLKVWKRGQRLPLVPFLALGGIVAVAVGWWA
jgi:prepilin signal peptidase PulO-like enzyme (type II secretory pathway)